MNAQRSTVLVGVDGSECARQALAWAAEDAATRGSGLLVAHILGDWPAAEIPIPSEVRTVAEKAGRETVDEAIEMVRRTAPGLPVDGTVLPGNQAGQLIRLAADAEQVVVGARGHGGFTKLLLGSVAAEVAAHSPCPVVVVRGDVHEGGPVVVGVDGSERGEAALDYAFAHAARRGLPVLGVHTYRGYLYPAIGAYPGMPTELESMRADSEELLQTALGRWTAKHPEVPVESASIYAGAATELIKASEQAGLLVVGCRGHGGFAGLLLGSVSQALVRHAHCPVAVAR